MYYYFKNKKKYISLTSFLLLFLNFTIYNIMLLYILHNVLIDITCSFHFKYKFRLCEILNNIISIFYLYCKLIIIL
ncbi:hypothetical protein PFAG_02671 [Plasmodium falciparum Santa Lucia]|uniref:Uncharacterized protein n=8 Tax=Plasmodium falciparum TaxID=5833 RepID=W7JUJ1_PLAFO|nr:hypothetical protein PFFVO_02692 [Plasmodium falciparum Vietnam Oak-Knoll (FVO)]ETW36576.1 hypothetical protein PFTANZ_02741 [Plasmodium falciparum Tanzania (2000708)]ETW39388.1 hypothetical protein PFNF135_06222 [Plasmodium falciparum NF135/5.C10]ETW56752.1 hypothetical protein PFUGPA_01218 [Plasmodium falciparum Palo Alto/Uganda]ETW61244.1 hypothetical protein PFMC_02664 [Plasmodium falciparum CAMP/Malaysia]EUT85963.1 hypothetical protein PFAG_02671 [Plasmodium falciparum Santa Lucia]EWC